MNVFMWLTDIFEHLNMKNVRRFDVLSTNDAGCRTERLCCLSCPILTKIITLFIVSVAKMYRCNQRCQSQVKSQNNMEQITSPCCKTNKLPFDITMEQVFVAPLFLGQILEVAILTCFPLCFLQQTPFIASVETIRKRTKTRNQVFFD